MPGFLISGHMGNIQEVILSSSYVFCPQCAKCIQYALDKRIRNITQVMDFLPLVWSSYDLEGLR